MTFTFRTDATETYRATQAWAGRPFEKVAWVPWAILAGLVVITWREGPQMESMWPAWALALTLAALGFVVPWTLRRRTAAATAGGSSAEQRYVLTSDGIVVEGTEGRLAYPWDAMRSVEETDDFFLFRLDARVGLALPQRAIGSVAERARLRRLLTDALGHRARLGAGAPRALG